MFEEGTKYEWNCFTNKSKIIKGIFKFTIGTFAVFQVKNEEWWLPQERFLEVRKVN